MRYPSFAVKEFLVPEFELSSGKMIRFWVQIVPKKEGQTDGYWSVKRITELIANYNKQLGNNKIYLCPNKVAISIFDFIKPILVGRYIEKVFGSSSDKIIKELRIFNIQPEYTLRDMGFAHQKLFTMVCGVEQHDIIVFDFYGFDPHTEIQLMEYIDIKLQEGKALIAFDNLGYKDNELEEVDKIENVIIKRV